MLRRIGSGKRFERDEFTIRRRRRIEEQEEVETIERFLTVRLKRLGVPAMYVQPLIELFNRLVDIVISDPHALKKRSEWIKLSDEFATLYKEAILGRGSEDYEEEF